MPEPLGGAARPVAQRLVVKLPQFRQQPRPLRRVDPRAASLCSSLTSDAGAAVPSSASASTAGAADDVAAAAVVQRRRTTTK
jgi:hypothetical protein